MTTSSENNDPLNLSALDFGPAWARKKDDKKKPARRDRGNAKSGTGGRKFSGKGGDRPRVKGGRPAPRQRAAAAEGIKATIMPIEEGIDKLVRDVTDSGRTYSVFDLARIILKDREKFNVAFSVEKEGEQELFQCKADQATFLTKAEALAYLASSGAGEESQFDELFTTSKRVFVSSQISFKLLSDGLATSLLEGISEQVRYPGELSSFLCRQLSGRQLAVYKWQGKLHAGPSRPHQLTAETALSERSKAIFDWATSNSGKSTKVLWAAVLTADVSDEDKQAWNVELQSLLKKGFLVAINHGGLHLSADSKLKPARKEKNAVKTDKKKDQKDV